MVMAMMGIVLVPVFMAHRPVSVSVFVHFSEMQPDPNGHAGPAAHSGQELGSWSRRTAKAAPMTGAVET